MRTLVAAIVLSFLSALFGGKAHRESERGNRAYEAGNHDEALARYTEAQTAAPDAPELHYDIGNALYRKEDYAAAVEAYRRALAGSRTDLLPDAAYNLGNAHFRERRFREAAEAYRQGLELRPDDPDARRNLELALRALERENRPEQEPQQQEQQERQDRQDQQQDPQQEQRPPQQEPEPRPERGEGMSPEEAERLLDRIAELEKEAMKRRPAKAAAGESPKEKDW